jgi:hypothetical protein
MHKADVAVNFITESILLHHGFAAGSVAAQRLGVSSHLVSRITGTIYIVQGDKNASMESCNKVNVGLNLKFNKRNEEVRCYWVYQLLLWLLKLILHLTLSLLSSIIVTLMSHICSRKRWYTWVYFKYVTKIITVLAGIKIFGPLTLVYGSQLTYRTTCLWYLGLAFLFSVLADFSACVNVV